jgi:glycosyltransferase involved in cell wall biosynthesis
MKQLRVMHMAIGNAFTGAVAAAVCDCRSLMAIGVKTILVGSPVKSVEAECARQGLRFQPENIQLRGLRGLVQRGKNIEALLEIIKKNRPHILHVHRAQEHVLAAGLLPNINQSNRPILVRSWHRSPGTIFFPVRKFLARTAVGHICVSRRHEESLRLAGARMARFIAPATDVELFKQREQKGALKTVIIGQVGRWKLGGGRGQWPALEVFRRLDPALPWHARLLGRGEAEGELRKRLAKTKFVGAKHIALTERVRILETAENYPQQLAELDIGLVFNTGSDGSSRPAVEMLASGVVLFVSDIDGLREFSEYKSGCENESRMCPLRGCVKSIPEHDYEKWAEELNTLIKDPKKVLLLKKVARKNAVEKNSLTLRGKRLKSLYKNLLERKCHV